MKFKVVTEHKTSKKPYCEAIILKAYLLCATYMQYKIVVMKIFFIIKFLTHCSADEEIKIKRNQTSKQFKIKDYYNQNSKYKT